MVEDSGHHKDMPTEPSVPLYYARWTWHWADWPAADRRDLTAGHLARLMEEMDVLQDLYASRDLYVSPDDSDLTLNLYADEATALPIFDRIDVALRETSPDDADVCGMLRSPHLPQIQPAAASSRVAADFMTSVWASLPNSGRFLLDYEHLYKASALLQDLDDREAWEALLYTPCLYAEERTSAAFARLLAARGGP